MKRNIITGGILALFTVAISSLAFIPLNGVVESKLTTWMSEVDDNKLVRELSIPGTHDSGATHSIADFVGKCQDLTIKEQLDIGVRFFDLRLKMVNDEFYIYHSFLDQKLSFNSVLSDLGEFVRENNEEFLLISIKQEESPSDSTLSFTDLFNQCIEPYSDVVSKEEVPTRVGEARGNIYIIDRYGLGYGIPAYYWDDNTIFETDDLYVQDYYCIDDINEKGNKITSTFEYSKTHNNKLTLNFLSCYFDNYFPPLYAGSTALLINYYIKNELNETNNDRLGVVIMDFASSDLTSLIVGGNY